MKKIKAGDKQWFWYDSGALHKVLKKIDLLIVDGLPGNIQKNSRYPAISILKKYFTPKTKILVDDTKRKDDNDNIKLWLNEIPNFSAQYVQTKKGGCIISPKM